MGFEEKPATFKPLPTYLTIKESEIEGKGLFAIKDIDSAEDLGLTHIYLGFDWMAKYYDNNWVRTPLGGFINHSDNPNCVIITKEDGIRRHLYTSRPIQNGEEITIYYTLYNLEEGLSDQITTCKEMEIHPHNGYCINCENSIHTHD